MRMWWSTSFQASLPVRFFVSWFHFAWFLSDTMKTISLVRHAAEGKKNCLENKDLSNKTLHIVQSLLSLGPYLLSGPHQGAETTLTVFVFPTTFMLYGFWKCTVAMENGKAIDYSVNVFWLINNINAQFEFWSSSYSNPLFADALITLHAQSYWTLVCVFYRFNRWQLGSTYNVIKINC